MNEVPASVTIIDREMIDASGVNEIAELFRLVPGFQVGHYVATDGHRTSVSYHGNSDQYARRMQVLIDGRSIYLPSTGGVSWDDLPIGMNEIERIEVIRGPNGVTYGVNSFQAVINIITLHSEATQGNEYMLTTGGQNENLVGIRTGGKNGVLNYRVNLQYEASDGFDDSVQYSHDRNDDSDTLRINLRTDYQIGVNDSLTVSAGYLTGAREVGHRDGGLETASNQTLDPVHGQDVTSSYQNLKYQHIIDSEEEINLQLYHNVHDLGNSYKTALVSEILTASYASLTVGQKALLDNITVDGTITTAELNAAMVAISSSFRDQYIDRNLGLFDERVGVELSHQLRIGKDIRAVWGAEFRLDRFRGYDWVDGTGETFTNKSQRIFFNGEWSPAGHWTVNLGDMLEKSDYMKPKHSPRIAVNWDIARNHYVRMGYSQAWRSPTFIESEFDYKLVIIPTLLEQQLFLNSEQLRPERIVVKEIAFGGGNRSSGIEYELRLFQEDMSDILVLPSGTVTNDGESYVNGNELALTLYPSQPGSTLRISYSRLSPSGQTGSPDNIADLVPDETLNILFTQKIGQGGLLGINVYHVDEMQFLAGDMGVGFTTANISYHHPVKLFGHKAKMSFSAQDILGNYFDFEKETVTKPQFYVGLKGDF